MKLHLPLSLLLAAVLAAPAAASDDTALGRDGEIYRLRQIPAGELPGAASPEAPALALETTFGDGTVTRLALPGTEDARIEDKAGLLFDEASSSLILYWQSRGPEGAVFRFASYDGELSPVGLLQSGAENGGPSYFSGDVQLATSRDAFAIQLANGQVIVAHRTILHVVWRELGHGRARYAPVIFVEGQWVGWTETVDLNGLVRSRHDASGYWPVIGPLGTYLELRIDEARRAAAITMVDSMSGRLSELEVRYLPMTLEQVGDRVRNRFFRIATVFKPSGDLESVNGELGYNIIHIGLRGLGSEALSALADGLRRGVIHLAGMGCDVSSAPSDVYVGMAGIGKDGVLGLPATISGEFMHVALVGRNPDQLESLIGGLGYNIIHIGSIAAGCSPTGDAHDMIQVAETGEILHIDMTGQRLSLDPANREIFESAGSPDLGQRAALIAVTGLWMRNEVMAPTASREAPVEVLIAPSSGDFLIAWVEGEALRFVQTQSSHWWGYEVHQVPLSAEMTPELAIELLRKKLR